MGDLMVGAGGDGDGDGGGWGLMGFFLVLVFIS